MMKDKAIMCTETDVAQRLNKCYRNCELVQSAFILVIILSLVNLPGGEEQTVASHFVYVSIKLDMHPAILL